MMGFDHSFCYFFWERMAWGFFSFFLYLGMISVWSGMI